MFKMDQSKKEFLSVLQGVKLSKNQSPTTAEDRKRMKVIPYASVIGSIKYAKLCTRPAVCLAIVGCTARMSQNLFLQDPFLMTNMIVLIFVQYWRITFHHEGP